MSSTTTTKNTATIRYHATKAQRQAPTAQHYKLPILQHFHRPVPTSSANNQPWLISNRSFRVSQINSVIPAMTQGYLSISMHRPLVLLSKLIRTSYSPSTRLPRTIRLRFPRTSIHLRMPPVLTVRRLPTTKVRARALSHTHTSSVTLVKSIESGSSSTGQNLIVSMTSGGTLPFNLPAPCSHSELICLKIPLARPLRALKFTF